MASAARSAATRRLHYEALARNNQAGFDAHRITITAPDGTEYSDVVWVDDETRAQLRDTAEQGPGGG